MARRKKRGGGRRLLVWTFRLTLLGVGGWLLYEAWRFPKIAPLARENPGRTSFQEWRIAQAGAEKRSYRIEQSWVPMARISRHLRRAVLAAEDARFYDHEGFDAEEIKDAIEDHWKEGKKLRGASTLSQQLAKNLWLGPERSLVRKLREAAYTFALERRVDKDRILELYLNVVEWGPGIFGAEAAARHWFGVPAAALDARQSALLAAALPAPLKRNPGRPSPALERRAQQLLRRMRAGDGEGGAAPAPAAAREETAAPEAGTTEATPAPSVESRPPVVAVTPEPAARPSPSPGPPVDLLAPAR